MERLNIEDEVRNCPYCGFDMVKGNLNGPQEHLQFFPDGTKPSVIRMRWHLTEGATIIKKFRMFRDSFSNPINAVPAYMCPMCKKVIIDIQEH